MTEKSQALCDLSAGDLIAGYAAGRLSPVEVLRSVLQRIELWEPHLRATYLLRSEPSLLQTAQQAEQRWRRGQPAGPLDGVPVTIKENIATAGDPMPLGTAAVALSPASVDSPPAARLAEAGAILVCKTTMPDYGMLSSGLSSFHPAARNPW
ncbi:MAG: amidase family protein, partial [Burkholderiales bacterium]